MHNNSSRKNAKIAVLIVAAGRGRRANSGTGSGLPKQYRALDGQMVLTKTLNCFNGFAPIVVAIHPDDEELFAQACDNVDGGIIPVHGGATRTASVKAGLDALQSHAPDIVLIHDGARPFLSTSVIDNVVQALEDNTAAVPTLPIVDAVKTLDGSSVDRDQLRRVQTPQGFYYADILRAYANLPDGADFADDIEVAQLAGMSIGFCQGDLDNIKLTFADDFMSKNMISITGSGYDVHQTCEGKSLFLCGIEIEADFSLKGHSDADVGLHALTDALLGTICAGDIGDHFPPTDAKWKGVNSVVFLEHAANLVRKQGGIIDHVDVTLICEQPKIKPHRQAMRTKIAETLNLPIGRVSVKATTTEGLGFTGRGEGIAASATASIRVPE
ncbi:MAG: bifunctional 2-C-methyl-D-erythritol 4-phosphate cytidylyltransferase/2-C-methyl-D-erythritol 2,4-cyclodiphosphate synthase [Robiginitomaculum sp.]|nr:bifunctional 2-C-methyl-D-erythritol 4-phosphate cytidylyltransferase/2-C-methyl-D-erythritol 2,4-cyclodiphosphate synthase [Robiginitomaculum sp.]